MNITTDALICNLQAGVQWIGEDESGNVIVTAASDLLAVVSRVTGEVQVDRWGKDSLYSVFLAGTLVRAVESGAGTALEFGDNRRIVVPIANSEIFSYCCHPGTRTIYILGVRDWLSCHVSQPPVVHIHSLGELPEIPQYERIEASNEGVIICQYGLIIAPNHGGPVRFDPVRFPYCKAAFLSDDTVIAALENRVIHTINTTRGIVGEMAAPRGSIYFLSRLGQGAVILWNDDNEDWGARQFYGAWFIDKEWHEICFGHIWAESFAVNQDETCVYIGTLDSLIRWDVRQGLYETATMPEQERVVALFWSGPLQKLFIGCRHGELYAIHPE